ncbi:MAG TPA: ABC transporter substrate-binding protein [Candidatus Angelobacter sp.]|nr:ABC transporter substrate-binding protein [Candidatus Angelobacter sp.]
MKLLRFPSIAAVSLLLALAATAGASSRPRYGGTVRILLQERFNSLDPLADDDHPAARDRVAALLFDTLTEMDAQGRVHPRLASSWRAEQGDRVWYFNLRLANFQDGTVVTAPDVVASLTRKSQGWTVTALDQQTVRIEVPAAIPYMPELLALRRFSIVKRNSDNTLVGSGPYRLAEWQPGQRVLLSANDDYWGGRPYPDSIEFQMGASLRDQLLERQLGPYSAADLTVDQLRSLEQSNQSLQLSRPSDLLVLLFLHPDLPAAGSRSARKPVDPRVREALSDAINRDAINNVILQKRGTPATGILPQWLTGYEFLLPGGMNLARAKELRAEAAGLVIIHPIALAYDYSDPMAKLVAERIAVDAREAGIVMQPYGEPHVGNSSARAGMDADAVLVRLPLESLQPAVALAAALDDMGLADPASAPLNATRLEDVFELEGKALQDFRVIPIAHVPQAMWLNSTVHNWLESPNGAWSLDQLWTEGGR